MRSIKIIPARVALLLIPIFLNACGGGAAGTTSTSPSGAVYSSMGTDFYLTLPDHLCVSSPSLCDNSSVTNKLVVAAASATTGAVTFNGVTTPFSVAAGSETQITLDPAVVLTSNETIESKGIHVTSQAPVSVHVMSEAATSADGYLALPTADLGTTYYVMSYASAKYDGSEFAVVATQDNTTVTITPTAAGATKAAGAPFSVVLNSGQTYQLKNPALGDMTGSFVSGDKPIGVFSGHRCTEVPVGIGYCDYLVEQMPDVSIWGKTYHTVPFSGRPRYTVRVIASQDGTTFSTVPAGLIGTLNAGQFADITMSGVGEFVASNPVLVAQFIRSYEDDTAGKGDPSMVIVTPTADSANEMGATTSTFGVYGLAGTGGELINIVTQTSALPNLTLDNTLVNPALFSPVSQGSIYSVATIPVTPGFHTLAGSVPYSALVYDYGIASNAVSYAYPVGGTLILPAATATTTPATTTSDSSTSSGTGTSGTTTGSDSATTGTTTTSSTSATSGTTTASDTTTPAGATTTSSTTTTSDTTTASGTTTTSDTTTTSGTTTSTGAAPTDPAPVSDPATPAPTGCASDNPGYRNHTVRDRQARGSGNNGCSCSSNGNAYAYGFGNGNGNAYGFGNCNGNAYAYGHDNGNGNGNGNGRQ